MLPDSQLNLKSTMQFLPNEELATFDPELFPAERTIEKLKAREALLKEYVDIRQLAYVASGLGKHGLSTL